MLMEPVCSRFALAALDVPHALSRSASGNYRNFATRTILCA
jgi:hypothetical protein